MGAPFRGWLKRVIPGYLYIKKEWLCDHKLLIDRHPCRLIGGYALVTFDRMGDLHDSFRRFRFRYEVFV
jgi:hypothetical protein